MRVCFFIATASVASAFALAACSSGSISSAGTGNGGSSGGDFVDAGGGFVDTGGLSAADQACQRASSVECASCCLNNHPQGARVANEADSVYETCACSTTCAQPCATNYCADEVENGACATCLETCDNEALRVCTADPDCAAAIECAFVCYGE
jgi:hypothetical protein